MTALLRDVKESAHGMLPIDVYDQLFKLGQNSSGGTFVEIGTAHGAATIALALGAKQQSIPFHIYTVDPFSGKYSSRTQFGSIQDNVSFLRSQFEKFHVDDCITVVIGSVTDLVAKHELGSINMLVLDADGRIDRDLSWLFDKLSTDCIIIVDDIDEWVGVSITNGLSFLDQKHRLSNMLVNQFTSAGILREGARMHSTGFFRKGLAALGPTEIALNALPSYRELVFVGLDHLALHPPSLKAWIGYKAPFVRYAYRAIRQKLRNAMTIAHH